MARTFLTPIVVASRTSDPSSPASGTLYYNSTSSELKYYNGTSWQSAALPQSLATTSSPTFASLTLTSPLTAANGGTGLSSLGTNVATWLGTPSSANLAAAITDETGWATGAKAVFSTGPTFGSLTGSGNYAIFASGGDNQGGSGYFDFLKVTNTGTGATNPNKSFRLNAAGSIQIANSAYTSVVCTLTDAGELTLSSTISASALAGSLLSSTNGSALGTASAGTSTIPARADHVHPTTGLVTGITGTANQILANATSGSAQTGSVTLTLPQSIATTSSPTFGGLTITSTSATSTSDLIQVKNSSSTVLAGFNEIGQPFTGTTGPWSYFGMVTTAASGDTNKATITTFTTHGLSIGDVVIITGLVPTGYNGTYVVTDVPSTTQFKYSNGTTGSQTNQGTVSLPAQLSVTARNKFTVPIIARAAGASTLMQVWQDSSGSNAAYVDSSGGFYTNSTITSLAKLDVTASAGTVGYFTSSNSSFTGTIMYMDTTAAAGTGWSFLRLRSDTGGSADLKVRIAGDGSVRSDAAYSSSGAADYAEYFEWEDGNPNNEDRRGISVTVSNGMIRPAQVGDVVVGVVSSSPVVIGDTAWNRWAKKYLTDDYGDPLYEDAEVWSWEEENVAVNPEMPDGPTDPKRTYSFFWDQVPKNVVVPANKAVTIVPRRVLNPDFDPDVEYIPREDRPEWSPIGLVGKLRIRKGQPVADNWVLLREVSASVDEWLVK